MLMEAKKNRSADVNRLRGLWFNFALVVSLLMVIMAFEWEFEGDASLVDIGATYDDFEEILEVPNTKQPPPPPPKFEQPEIIEVEDEETPRRPTTRWTPRTRR